jgi:hypothetical protein
MEEVRDQAKTLPDVYRPAKPAKLVYSTKESRDVLLNVVLTGKSQSKSTFLTLKLAFAALRII